MPLVVTTPTPLLSIGWRRCIYPHGPRTLIPLDILPWFPLSTLSYTYSLCIVLNLYRYTSGPIPFSLSITGPWPNVLTLPLSRIVVLLSVFLFVFFTSLEPCRTGKVQTPWRCSYTEDPSIYKPRYQGNPSIVYLYPTFGFFVCSSGSYTEKVFGQLLLRNSSLAPLSSSGLLLVITFFNFL